MPSKEAHRLDGVRGHSLMPSGVARRIPPLYSQDSVEDPMVWVKFFSPFSGAVYYITEYDPSSKTAFGWADLGMGHGELGYISVDELEGSHRRGLPLVERDLHWKPMPLSRAKTSRTADRVASKHLRAFSRVSVTTDITFSLYFNIVKSVDLTSARVPVSAADVWLFSGELDMLPFLGARNVSGYFYLPKGTDQLYHHNVTADDIKVVKRALDALLELKSDAILKELRRMSS